MINENELPEGWEVLKIKDVIDKAINGGTPKKSESEYWGGDIPWLSSSEVRGKRTGGAEETITEDALSESSAKMFPEGSVLVTMYGGDATNGRATILSKPMSGNQAICCLVVNTEICTPEYMWYYLKFARNELMGKARGGLQKNLNQSIIKEQEIIVPPLGVQEGIVAALDEGFEHAERLESRAEQLEQLANEYKSSSYNESFHPSAVSTDAIKLKDAVDYHSNLVTPEEDEEYTLIELSDVEEGTGRITNKQRKKGSDIGSNKREFTDSHILYCKLRPYLAKVVKSDFSGVASSELLVLEPTEEFSREFIHKFLLSDYVTGKAEHLMKGANHPRISKSKLMEFQVPNFGSGKQEQIISDLDAVEDSVAEVREYSGRLKSLSEEYRESLLHSAFTGELVDE